MTFDYTNSNIIGVPYCFSGKINHVVSYELFVQT